MLTELKRSTETLDATNDEINSKKNKEHTKIELESPSKSVFRERNSFKSERENSSSSKRDFNKRSTWSPDLEKEMQKDECETVTFDLNKSDSKLMGASSSNKNDDTLSMKTADEQPPPPLSNSNVNLDEIQKMSDFELKDIKKQKLN